MQLFPRRVKPTILNMDELMTNYKNVSRWMLKNKIIKDQSLPL
jgi:hypothetical protein